MKTDYKKYLLAFTITAIIFSSAIFVSNQITGKRVAEIQTIENRISEDLLSSEIQFALLKELPCSEASESILSPELNDLASRLSYMENSLGENDSQVIYLKKNYSLLEIKDYLLMRSLNTQCKVKPISILYFYSNEADCSNCKREEYVLSYLRDTYPDLRIYSFDYNLDLSAIETLISIYKIKKEFPALVIKDKVYNGFQGIEDIQKFVPELKVATSTATTTSKR